MTLAEAMAMAVLKGDMAAAYALADKLLEERDTSADKIAEACRKIREGPIAVDGYLVYSWPEFQAFCKRAGIYWDLRTKSITFTLEEGTCLFVKQEYLASDMPPDPAAVDTTTLQTGQWRTYSMPARFNESPDQDLPDEGNSSS